MSQTESLAITNVETTPSQPDWSSFFAECDRAPRLNDFHRFFSQTAGGITGQPTAHPEVDLQLLKGDELLDRIVQLHKQRRGRFDPHYHASIPYRLEEACRLARGILEYSKDRTVEQPLHFYSMGSAEGTMSRVVAELGEGRVKTLACSPNIENGQSFLSHGDPPNASFFVGPMHHLTKDVMRTREDLARFTSGFDIMIEDTTFQMYSPNRPKQIEFAKQKLKDNGIFLFVSKYRCQDLEEYKRREVQKDVLFKPLYFSQNEIKSKGKEVLNLMNKNEVSIEDMTAAIGLHFSNCYMLWNSGNFYTLAASNSADNLERFMAGLVEPAVPKEFMYETLPRRLI